MKTTMVEAPTISETVIDNLITRKEIRGDALRRLRARDRLEPHNLRTKWINKLLEVNSESMITKSLIQNRLDEENFPEHLALIPDGNRRWAESRGLRVGEGYAAGAEKIKDFRRWSLIDHSTDIVSVFLLSTENIERRPEEELEQLFGVFNDFFEEVPETDEVNEFKIRHEVRGNRNAMNKLPTEVKDSIQFMEEETKDYSNKRLIFLIPYGGRDEIIRAARKTNNQLSQSGQLVVSERGEDETEFRQHLDIGDLPDVDLMIRTSEIRLSNFMLWHNAYAEFVFLKKHWPSFTEADFYESIYKYANRDRRFGV